MAGPVQLYDQILKETVHDDEVNSWPLMDSPWPVLSIVIFYLYFVLYLGPKIMENRKSFDLKYVMVVYNFYQVVFSSWLCSRFFLNKTAIVYAYNNGCHPPVKNPFQPEFYASGWWYFMSKVIELLDTVFFVLRKKQKQVTVLHLYHHSIMVLSCWGYLKYIKGEQGLLPGVLNSFVHVVMYLYYLLAAMGPRVKKYLWWKKYITKLQVTQFILCIVYLSSLLVLDCSVPKALSLYMVFNCTVFLALFLNFYRKAYSSPQQHPKAS